MKLTLDPKSVDDYRSFLSIKSLPVSRFVGRDAIFPDEYASRLGMSELSVQTSEYEPSDFLFDYQRDISRMAVEKQKFAVFADCGLGKTLILLEFARHAAKHCEVVLIVSPLMVCSQTVSEAERFYGSDLPIEYVSSSDLQNALDNGRGVYITNYEAIKDDLEPGKLGALILDESSMLKSHYGKWGTKLIELGRGLSWKLCLTGTPAPNDRIEYANHAVFLDAFQNVNAFLATYFVNRGQTSERWVLKPHALRPFYRSLSHWCIFLTNPATYGWKDNTETVPPIHVQLHTVDMTPEQNKAVQQLTGGLFASRSGGIGSRASLGQIAKGRFRGERIPTNKPGFIRDLVASWSDEESTIVWCLYNDEQEQVSREMSESASVTGSTPYEERVRIIDDFKSGRCRTLITKPKILGFGLNLQVATRQVFSGLQDSYESYYQAVKRSNRYGSTKPLHVHIPATDIELPMIENVLSKRDRVLSDTQEQEELFKEYANESCC